jgi:hypothetical protein
VDVESCFGQSLSSRGEGTYRPSLLLVGDLRGRIEGMIGMSDIVVMKLELGLIPTISYRG